MRYNSDAIIPQADFPGQVAGRLAKKFGTAIEKLQSNIDITP